MQAEFERSLSVNRYRTAIRFEGVDYTYADLERWSRAVAHQLRSFGVGVGDTVALYLNNAPEFIATDVAIARLGAVKAPVNYMLASETATFIIEASNARVVVGDERLLSRIPAPTRHDTPIPVLQTKRSSTERLLGVEWLADLPPADLTLEPLGPSGATSDDDAAIYFTGGTTGKPKGVVHTQASTVALHYAQLLEAEILETERLLLMTPLAHAAGLFAQSAILRGATVLLYDGFDAQTAVELISSGEATWSFLVPTMIYRLLDLLDQGGQSHLNMRTIVYGAAPIAPVRLEQALRIFGPIFIQLYGQSEAPNWGTRLTKSDHDPARPDLLTSCGRASIMADVKVVDDAGQEVPPGVIGEICLRAPYVLREYLNQPEATEEKFLGEFIRTGDIGEMNDDGYLFLKDRKNDMVISGGMNVYSREVEDALSAHPDVKAVAVIGIPHPDWGEAVHAIVIRGDGTDLDEASLIAWSRDRLAAYARPKSVEFVESLPETAFGKVDKKVLRAPHWAQAGRAIS